MSAEDLHHSFTVPTAATVEDRASFLRAADRLPGMRPVRAALRRWGAPPEGGTLVDAGCGAGTETARLAAAHPTATVIGLDHDAAVLGAARRDNPGSPNLQWCRGDVTAPGLPPASVDVVRTERVLMYVASLERAVASVRSVLRVGGRFVGFELDYGATILPLAGASARDVRRWTAALEHALPQPWAGRRLPEALAAGGMTVTDVEPVAFTVDTDVWSRVVADTLLATGDPAVGAWLGSVGEHAPVRAVFTGLAVAAERT